MPSIPPYPFSFSDRCLSHAELSAYQHSALGYSHRVTVITLSKTSLPIIFLFTRLPVVDMKKKNIIAVIIATNSGAYTPLQSTRIFPCRFCLNHSSPIPTISEDRVDLSPYRDSCHGTLFVPGRHRHRPRGPSPISGDDDLV